jgi:aspartyl-tRNA(Asn)/glutamyl-tRNA(Gln) amidotransferase subunit B
MPAAALAPEIMAKYEPVIGLEVHVQLLTATKALPGLLGAAGRAASLEREGCRVCYVGGAGYRVQGARAVDFCAEELFLS